MPVLPTETVRLIRRLHKRGDRVGEIATRLDLSRSAVSRAVNGHTYPNVKDIDEDSDPALSKIVLPGRVRKLRPDGSPARQSPSPASSELRPSPASSETKRTFSMLEDPDPEPDGPSIWEAGRAFV